MWSSKNLVYCQTLGTQGIIQSNEAVRMHRSGSIACLEIRDRHPRTLVAAAAAAALLCDTLVCVCVCACLAKEMYICECDGEKWCGVWIDCLLRGGFIVLLRVKLNGFSLL